MKTEKEKKIPISTIVLILMVIAGLALLLYPTTSDYINTKAYRKAVDLYRDEVAEIDDETYEQFLEQARDFNRRLSEKSIHMLTFSDKEREEYNHLLDVTGTGIMGYVEVPAIDVSLPIYHGSSIEVLQSGAGHVEGSSLPVGGKGTHAIIAAHRGLPSARLFTDLDLLEEGDIFTISVLREVLTYEVDFITTVDPLDTEDLLIEPDQDYCTLLTCTPYGVNTQRLLVRGHRIPTMEVEQEESQALKRSEYKWGRWKEAVFVIAFATLAVTILIVLGIRNLKNNRKIKKQSEK